MATAVRPLNTWDIAKVVAVLLMFVDHSGSFFFETHVDDSMWLRAVGRGAAPIFLYLAGYAASYRFSREIFVLALLMVASNWLMGEYLEGLNILAPILAFRAWFSRMEQRKQKFERPYEWMVGAISLAPVTMDLFQYGTFGFLFSMSGFLRRHPQDYPEKVQKNFLRLTFVIYGLLETLLFRLSAFDVLLMTIVLLGVYRLLDTLEVRPVNTAGMPTFVVRLLKWLSFYSAYIYAFHLIILSWITHMPN